MENQIDDAAFTIPCTGDAVVGDEVCFEKSIFEGSYRRPKFVGTETVVGKIIKDSYGKDKQQHTFTLELPDGSKMLIKGRNLYRHGLWRKKWDDESLRTVFLDEKHERGAAARSERGRRLLGVM